jgi:hypothetical protein
MEVRDGETLFFLSLALSRDSDMSFHVTSLAFHIDHPTYLHIP